MLGGNERVASYGVAGAVLADLDGRAILWQTGGSRGSDGAILSGRKSGTEVRV